MDLLPKIDEQWKCLEELVDSVSQPQGSQFQTALSRIISAIDQVSICFRRINEEAMRRQELVEKHCNQENQLTLSMHEEYHEINAVLLSDINSFFSMIKTYLNSLALFIKEIIPQSQLRGLRFKSFGSLVESAKWTAESDLPNSELRKFIAKNGAEFEKNFVEYRDKHLEHPGKLFDKTISSSNGVPKIIHYDRKGNSENQVSDTNNDKIHTQKERITMITSEGHEVTFFHIALSENIKLGTLIKQGQPLGEPYDSTGSHFKKYGCHYHVFTAPEIDNSLVEQTAPGGAPFALSPDPYEAILFLGKLTESVILLATKAYKDFNA
jgi:hypothetical protein